MGQQEGGFAAVLRRYRLATGLTQEELAERAAVSVRAVSDLERGLKTRPYRHTVHALATALRLSPEDRAALEAAAGRKRQIRPGQSPALPAQPPHRLPVPPTSILGREREEALVVHLLRREGRRLITLTGAGGVGKTRLALEVARTVAGEYADGALFVSLAALTDPAHVPAAVASALGLRSGGSASPERRLLAHLAERELLVVLDNFEQILPAGPFVAQLLAGSPRLSVLATSRAPLRLRGEQQIAVGPLAVPERERLPPPEEVGGFPAVALFVQRAQAVQPRFALTEENAAAVVEICRGLDGLPLALELAAARIRILPPPALLARLSRRLELLTGGAADAPARQQTLRSTMEWSYGLLDAAEQTLFARLSVFAGGCTLAAAGAVCGADGEQGAGVLGGVASLVEKSLLRAEGEEPRFALPETIREYAQERLEVAGTVQDLKWRHGRYYLALAEGIAAGPQGPEQAARLDRLEAERDNLRAALQWARDSGNVELGLRLAVALGHLWERRGPLSEGQRWLEELLAADAGAPPTLRAAALFTAGQLSSQRQSGEAAALLERSLAIYRELGDRPGGAAAGAALALEILHRGDLERAEDLLEESVALGRELGDKELLAASLHLLAGLAAGQGDAERARDLGDQSLALYRELEDTGRMAAALRKLLGASLNEGHMPPTPAVPVKPLPVTGEFWGDYTLGLAFGARSRGDYRHAMRLLEALLAQALEVGDRRYAAYPRAALGLLAREQGDYERAAALYRESLAVFQEVEDVWGAGSALVGLSDVARDRGDAERVIELAEHGLRLFRQVGDPWFTGYSLHNLGIAARYQGDHGRSEALLAEALALFRGLRGEGPTAEVLSSLGLLALEQGDDRRAEQAFAESLRIARAGGMRWVLGALLEGMAGVAAGRGQAQRAARLFGVAEALRTTIGTPIWPANHALYERHVGAARTALGEERLTAAWQVGRAMPPGEAIADALGDDAGG